MRAATLHKARSRRIKTTDLGAVLEIVQALGELDRRRLIGSIGMWDGTVTVSFGSPIVEQGQCQCQDPTMLNAVCSFNHACNSLLFATFLTLPSHRVDLWLCVVLIHSLLSERENEFDPHPPLPLPRAVGMYATGTSK